MRKIVSILLFVAIATVLAVGSASAASIVGSAHDMTSMDTTLGTCSACHIPHKTAGTKRLWAKAMGNETDSGTVGNLCTACHGVSGGYTGTCSEASKAAYYVLPAASRAVMAHRLASNWATSSTGTDANDELSTLSGLPYLTIGSPDPEDTAGGTNLIQCTSCHNVHDNANRPFLRRDIRDLCVTCHKGRAGGGTADAGSDTANLQTDWNYTTNAGINNYGSHPVGSNVNKSISARAETITFTVEWFNFFEGDGAGAGGLVNGSDPTDGSGRWNLGRHAATGTSLGGVPGPATDAGKIGGVVCVSCHAVHGYQDDANALYTYAGNMRPVNNLLGIEQSGGTIGVMEVYNGNTDPANFLCESCHHNSNPTGVKWTNPAAWASANFHQNDAAGTVYAGTMWPNPGATAYTHPIDDAIIVSPDTLVTSFNAGNWPSSGDATTDNPICESCHVPHPTRDLALGVGVRTDINAGAAAYILRDDLDEICNGCHTASGVTVPQHHPTGTMANMAGVAVPGSGRTGAGAATTNTGGGNSLIGNSDDQLTCGDCHNAGNAGGAAHNWNDRLSGIALDPDWDADSESCEQCHYRIRAGVATIDNANLVPTQDAGEDWGTADYGEYNKGAADSDAIGTHFLGDIASGFNWSLGQDSAGATFNAQISAWPTNIPGVSTFTGTDAPRTILAARGAGDAAPPAKGHLICESCHELEPRKNNGAGGKLLFADFAEGSTPSADADSYFCEGCHGHNPGAVGSEGSHPLSGDIVSGTGSIPDTSKFPAAGNATYPSTGGRLVSCDSCHQVHDAVTNSATFILDGADTSVSINSGYTLTSGRGGSVAGSHNEHPRGLSQGGVYDGMGRLGLDYTVYCQQCHVY